mgnify:FL=1
MLKTPFPKSVIIIGCGIVGAATAFFLAGRGVDVTIIEREGPAAAATGAADGAVSVASKKPGPMMTAALAGISVYRDLLAQGILETVFKPRPTYVLASSDEEVPVVEAHVGALRSAGVAVNLLDRKDIHGRFPALSPEVRLGAEVKDDGHAIGYAVVHRLLTASGVKVRRRVEARSLIVSRPGHVTGVETAEGKIEASAVVITAGSGSDRLLGLDGVLMPRKGQLLVTERAPELNASMPGSIMSGRYLLSKGTQKGGAPSERGYGLVIDPLTTGQFLIGGTRENNNAGKSNDLEAVARILRDAVALVPRLAQVRLLRAFAGIRTAVADGLPLIGRAPAFENVFVATGFEGDGICLGPVVGKAVASLILGEPAPLDLSAFNPARFAPKEIAA